MKKPVIDIKYNSVEPDKNHYDIDGLDIKILPGGRVRFYDPKMANCKVKQLSNS